MIVQLNYGRRSRKFDIVLACCGYESRSRAMLEKVRFDASSKLAIGYGTHEVLAFKKNRKAFRDVGFEVVPVADDDFQAFLRERLDSIKGRASGPRILLDLSCFTRHRLALIIETLVELPEFELEVFYSLAEYSPAASKEPRNEHLCPVSPFFAGWTGESEKAVALVSGLGYEQLRALGIMEHIDPYESWFFFPISPISQYDVEVRRANSLLLQGVARSNVIPYDVMDGPLVLHRLLSLTKVVRSNYRCVLMPLGPKIFAFAALFLGAMHRDVSVWRASAGRFAEPKDRRGSSHWTKFSIHYDRGPVE